MWYVRIEFTFQNERFHEFYGPFDRAMANLACEQFAYVPYMHGMTAVHVERALVVPERIVNGPIVSG